MSSSSPLNSPLQDAVPGHNVKSGVGAPQHAAGVKHGEHAYIERGYVPVRQLTGKVVGVWGDAHIRLLNGDVVPLHVGDVVHKGEVVLTTQDGIIQIEASRTLLADGTAGADVERIISQVNQGDADVVPAAGPNSGGAAGSLGEGLRVGRDAEAVTPASLDANPLAAPTVTTQPQAVAPLATGPAANADSETTAVNTPVVFDPRSNDSSTTAITIVAVAGHPIDPSTPVTLPQGTVTMNPDGTLTFTPNHDVSGSISFSYTESNGSASTSTSTVTVIVSPASGHVPTAADDAFSGHENAVITGNVATNDAPSIDGGNHWQLATGTAHGTVTLDSDGTFSYAPTANYSGPDSFTYTVTDVDGSTSTATVTLNVAPVPLAADDTIAARQNTLATGNLAANDTAAAGEINTWAVATPPAHGQVTVNADGTFTYAPTANYSGSDTFTYTITAADGSTATATAHVEVVADPLATASIGLRHDAVDDTGAASTDSLTGTKQPIIEGTGQPDSTVTVSVTPAGVPTITYTAPTDSTGHWSIDTATQVPVSGTLPLGGLPDGDVALGVSTTNGTGITTTATGSLVVDSTPPVASIDLKHDTPNDTGTSSTDGVTSNPHPVLVGTGEPDSTVIVTVTPNGGAAVTYAVKTNGSGDWSVDTSTTTPTTGALPPGGLTEGSVGLQVVSTDSAGNATTATGSFTEDRTPPAASVDLAHDGIDDTGVSATDGLTNNQKPVLTGTGEPNGTVDITITLPGGAKLTYTASTEASGNWSLDTNAVAPTGGTMPPTGLPNGSIDLEVVSTDAAGNTTTATGAFTEFNIGPAASIGLRHDATDDTGVSSGDSLTNNAKPVLTGMGEPNSTVDITVTLPGGAKLTYTAPTDASGNWSLDTSAATPVTGSLPAGGIPEGNVGLQVVTTDSIGNQTTAGGSFTEDRTDPTVTIGLKHDAVGDTGSSTTDDITNNTKPVIVGTSDVLSGTVDVTVTDSAGHKLTYTAATDAAGNWSIDTKTATATNGATMPTAGLSEGQVALSVVATDAAGNSATVTGAFTEDLTAPVATVGLKHDATDDTGSSTTDSITNNTKPVIVGSSNVLSGTVDVVVTDSAGHKLTYTAATDASGNWSIDTKTAATTNGVTMPTTGLAEGQVALTIVAMDSTGNQTVANGAFTEDLTAPVATIGLKHDAADDTGSSTTDSITNNTKPVIVGTSNVISGTVDVSVTDSAGHKLTYTAATDASGNWSIDTKTATTTSGVTMSAAGLSEGQVALTVVATDAAGNSATATGSFTEDVTAPVATTGLKHDATDDTGSSVTDSITNNTKPVIVGTSNVLSGTVAVTVTDSAGHKLTYTAATDASGNWSIDTKSATTSNGVTLPATGLSEGQVALTVVATDAAGNSASSTGSFTEDLTAPVATIGLKHDAADDTGSSTTDSITNNTKPVIVGTSNVLSGTVDITVTDGAGHKLTYAAATDSAGTWSIDTQSATTTNGVTMPTAGLAEGQVALSVVATDAAGNSATATGSFTEDLTAPVATIGLKHDAADDTGSSATDSITNNTKPVIVGISNVISGTVDVTVTDSAGHKLTYTAATDASGNWSIDTKTATTTNGVTMPTAGLSEGQVALSIVATDAAGNSASSTGSFTEDLTAPVATIGLKHDAVDDTGSSTTDSVTNNTKPVIVGTSNVLSGTVAVTVTDSAGHKLTYTAATDSAGTWSIDTQTATTTNGVTMPTAGLAEGQVALSVVATDAAGNSATATGSFTEDLTAPVATIGLNHDAADDTGSSTNDSITNNTKPVIVGTSNVLSGTVDVTVTDSAGHKLTYTATTDTSGNWSIDTKTSTTPNGVTMPAAGLSEGQVALSVVSTDAAGNSTTSTGSFTEDLTAPVATIGLKHDAADDTGSSTTDSITNNTKPVIVGTSNVTSGTVDITVTDSAGHKLTYTAATDASGNWSIDTKTATTTNGVTMPAAGLSEGQVVLTVVATDAAGNGATVTGAFTEDLTAPVATVGLKHDAADDTGSSTTDSITNNTKPVIVGTSNALSGTVAVTVTDSAGHKLTYTATTDASGNWSIDTKSATTSNGVTMPAAGLSEGQVALTVVATDAAGNSASSTGSFTEDLTAPVATIGLKHDAVDDTGSSATDSITNNTKPVIVGTSNVLSGTVDVTVTDSAGHKLTYTATTDASGNWSIDTQSATTTNGVTMPTAGLAEGQVALSVVATDAAGNSATATGSFTEDLTAPVATVGLKHDATDDTGSSTTDSITNNTKPVIVGTSNVLSGTVDITVTDSAGHKLTYTATTDASGNWSIDTQSATTTNGVTMPAAGLSEGQVALSVVATDAAGNSATATGSFTENLTAPVATIGLKHDAADDTGSSTTDSITNNTKPVIVGTSNVLSGTVDVVVTDSAGHKLTYTAATDASGNWSIDTKTTATTDGVTMPTTGLAEGQVALTIVAIDSTGNQTAANGAFTEDLTAPVATIGLKHDAADDTGSSTTDSITNNTKPIIVGTSSVLDGTVDVTVTDSAGHKLTYTAATDASGNWSIDTKTATTTNGVTMPTAGLSEGQVALSIVATDAAGNSASSTGSFTEDLTAPVATIGLKHDAVDDTGSSTTDSVTNNTKPVIVGTSNVLSGTVAVTFTDSAGHKLTYTAATDASGNWSIDTKSATTSNGVTMPAAGLSEGQVALTVVATDAAGNSATATGSFTEDLTAPVAAIGLKHDAADDTGSSITDSITNNTKPVIVGTSNVTSGTVDVTVTDSAGHKLTYTATTDTSGNWSIDTKTATTTNGVTMPAARLSEGQVALSVVATDAAGNSTTSTGSFTEDLTAPVATIGLKHDAADDTGSSTTDSITNNTKPVIVGTSNVLSGTVAVTVTDSAGHKLTYTVATDAAGNWSIDTKTAATTNGVTMPAAGLSEGQVALTVVAADVAGNSTIATGSFTEDLTAPVATVGLKHDATDDTGSSTTDSITNNTKPVIVGTSNVLSGTVAVTVTDSAGHKLTYSATTDASGNWSIDTQSATTTNGVTMPTAGLSEGQVALSVVATDAAGNSATATGSFTEDLTAPVATIGLKHDAADDTGSSVTDSITNNTKPVIVGTSNVLSGTVDITVTDSAGNKLTYIGTTDPSGNWSIDTKTATTTNGVTMPATGLAEGQVALTVIAKDVAGNSATATSSFLEDRTAPTTPTIGLKHDAANDTGSSTTDNITANVTPILVGVAEALSTVTITVTPSTGAANAVTYTTTADASGNWSINTATATPTSGTLPASGLPDGSVGLKVVSTDAAGNVSGGGTSAFAEQHATAPTLTATDKTYYAATDLEESGVTGSYGNVSVTKLGTGSGTTTTTHAGTWQTDNGGNTIEIGLGSTYGVKNADGTSDTSHVIELEQNPNDASNLYTTMTTKVGEVYNLSFDYAARGSNPTSSVIYVYWEGQLVDTLNTQSATLTHVNLKLVSTTAGGGKLEFVAGDSNSFGGVLDNVTLGLATNTGIQGYATNLPAIAAGLVDTDPSETLKVTIDTIPAGATLTDGTHTFTATAGNATADVTGWTLGSLSMTSPTAGDFTLGVHATTTETANGSTATTNTSVTVHVLDDSAGVYGTTGNDTMAWTDASASVSTIHWGLDGNDSLTGSIGHDTLMGGAGNDTLRAGSGPTLLDGGIGNDSLVAGSGADTLSGGKGNDTMVAGTTSVTDVFKWHLADGGSEGTTSGHAAVDTIINFDAAKASSGGDILDLRDLLVGENAGSTTQASALTHFLDFDTTTSAGSTIIHISSHGDFANGYAASNEDQTIVLQGVDLRASMGLAANSTDAQVISELLNRGKLMTDGQ